MRGAREYYNLILGASEKSVGKLRLERDSGSYRNLGNMVFQFSEHARGKEFHIYIVKSLDDVKMNGLYNAEKLEVYGVAGGQLGWTEWYDWLIAGPWQKEFNALIVKLQDEALKAHAEESERVYKSEIEERERKKKEIEYYAKLFESRRVLTNDSK